MNDLTFAVELAGSVASVASVALWVVERRMRRRQGASKSPPAVDVEITSADEDPERRTPRTDAD